MYTKLIPKLTSITRRNLFTNFFKKTNTDKKPIKLGHTAVVIGGTSEIGEAICRSLLKNGVRNLVLASTNQDKGINLIRKLKCSKPDSYLCHIICDVTNNDDVDDVFERTIKLHGPVDVTINNAGIMDENDWYHTVDVNTKGIVHGTSSALKYMSEEEGGIGGTIINVSSGLGFLGGAPVFTASKCFVLGLSKCYAHPYYYKKTNVRIMTLLPGLTQTGVIKKLMSEPNDDLKSKLLSRELQDLEPNDQHPSYCGKAIEKMLRNGTNGSLWVAEDERLYQISIPEFRQLKIRS